MNAVVVLQAHHSGPDIASTLRVAGWEVSEVHHPRELAAWPAHPAGAAPIGVVVLDSGDGLAIAPLAHALGQSEIDWIALLPREALAVPDIASLVVTACQDFQTLPIDCARLIEVLQHNVVRARLARDFAREAASSEGRFGMLGLSSAMQALYRDLEKMARDDAAVLITGESGTGKEKAARALHEHSDRAMGPFVAVNSAALPGQLIQSELFGHEKGAFTGAFQRHIGSIEAAAGGVIFFDEIGDLPLDQQANLLRFLQERSIVRVGSSRPIPVDVRVIAATNVDLPARIADGRFREDLYYRLNVLQLKVPPLRNRGSDIELIAKSCLRRFVARHRGRARGFSSAALTAMMVYDWPGNVRDLINRIQQAVILSENRLISAADLGLASLAPAGLPPTLSSARAELERDVIERTLARNRGNVSASARELGVSRVTLYRLIGKLKPAGTGRLRMPPIVRARTDRIDEDSL